MRSVRTSVAFSESSFQPKILSAELSEEAFRHQSLRLLTTHVHKPEQEGYVPNFAEFVGQTVTVTVEDLSLSESEAAGSVVFFEGPVTRSGLSYEPGQLQLLIEARSGSIEMDRVPRTRIFQDTTLRELLDQIVADYQGSALESVDISLDALGKKRITFAAQWGETDWEFVQRLCRKLGLFAAARNRDLFIHTGSPWTALSGLEVPADLVLGQNLFDLQLGLSSAATTIQASSYQHFGEQGLDPGRGDQAEDVRTWTGPSEQTPPSSALAQSIADAASGSPEGSVVEVDDHFSQQEFDAISSRWSQSRIAGMITGEGMCDALEMGVGTPVQIAPAETRTFDSLAGDRFMVRGAQHTIADGVYSAHIRLCVEGHPPLLDPAAGAAEPDVRLLSATVTAAHDESNVGRVMAMINAFGEDALEEPIPVRCLSEASGDGHGTLNLPEVGDEVILALDPRSFAAPLALGSVYNGLAKTLVDQLPSHAKVDAGMLSENNIKYYLSKAGTCVIHDAGDPARLMVTSPNVSILLSEQDGLDIHVRGSSGECQITGQLDGALAIKAKNITIEAEQAIEIKSGTGMKLGAGTDLNAEAGTNFKSTAGQNYEMKANMQVKEEAGMTYEIKGGLNLKLQAVKIDIN